MTSDKQTPGTGTLECDENGLVVERFSDGSCSFDIFDAVNWPGTDEEGMAYARLIVQTVNAAQGLLEALDDIAKGMIPSEVSLDQEPAAFRSEMWNWSQKRARAAIAKAETQP